MVWGEYSGALRAAIIALKHGRRDELARPLGRRLAAAVAVAGWADEIEVVAAIPSHPAHHVRRGYSAANLVARAVASECELVFTSPLRRHGTGRQTGRSRAQRLQLPRRCFSVRGGIAGRRLLVVDDVSTTGTTLRRAAESALEGGARAVFCAALARTPDPRRPA